MEPPDKQKPTPDGPKSPDGPKPPDDRIGKYTLIKRMARGGMGDVYMAQQTGPAGFTKVCVVKLLREELMSDGGMVELFLNEARLAGQLSHHHLLGLTDFGEDLGRYYLVMEYVHGASARAVLSKARARSARIPPAVAATICTEALRGLHYAHTLTDRDGAPLRIVHRDISPENILIDFHGISKVADFGIAKALGVSKRKTRALHGKLHYMAPERLLGERADAKMDIYGVGVVLYELLTGRLPFDAPSDEDLTRAILRGSPPPVRTLVPSVDPELDAAVLRALSRDPNQRFESAAEMARALWECVERARARGEAGDVAAFLVELFGEAWIRSNPAVQRDFLQREDENTQALPRRSATPVPRASQKPTVPTPRRTPFLVGAAVSLLVLAAAALLVLVGRGMLPAETKVPVAAAAAPPGPAPAPREAAPPAVVMIDATRTESAKVLDTEPAPEGPEPAGERGAPVVKLAKAERPERPPPPSRANARRRLQPARRSEPPAAREPAPPVPAAPGHLTFRVRPWAEVVLDGRVLGITPLPRTEVTPGKYKVVLRNRELGVTTELTVDIVSGQETEIRRNLQAGPGAPAGQ